MGALPGIAIGHWHDADAITGCTVLLPEAGVMRAGVCVGGSAPGTRETDLLAPTATIQEVHAVLLTGGSAFGLAAAGGVMSYLRERGIGFDVRVTRVPIVPAAVIFDLDVGAAEAHPTAEAGRSACQNASSDEAREGTVGAGYGATIGKLLGHEGRMKGGLGLAALTLGPAHVGALAVVNCGGDVIDGDGRIIAGTRRGDGFAGSDAVLRAGALGPWPLTNTTLVAVATDAGLDKVGLTRLARLAHDGLARAISPVHTTFDGDTVFALSTGEIPMQPDALGSLAVEAVAAAIRRAVRAATGVGGVPALADLA